MGKYPIKLEDGSVFNVSHIGVNHTSLNSMIGGLASSYDGSFTDEDEVNIESEIGDYRYCVIGDVKEAYQMFKEILLKEKPQTIFEYAECIQKVILNYFGDYSNTQNRLTFFPDEDSIEYFGLEVGKVSSLAHQNAAMCIERAMLSQNLLKIINVKSFFKASGIIINGKMDAHAYNLIEFDGKYYLFDATIPTLRNDKISPIIGEIPKEVFDQISKPNSDIGISINVNHYNPLQKKDYAITYDAGRKETYSLEDTKTK